MNIFKYTRVQMQHRITNKKMQRKRHTRDATHNLEKSYYVYQATYVMYNFNKNGSR